MVMKQPFEQVVEQHGGTVLRVCRVVLGVHDAEDAWSETFLAAMRAYPDLPDDANAEAWLVTIAHRKAIDVLRARKRQPAPVGDVPEAPTTLGVPGDGDIADGTVADWLPGIRDEHEDAAGWQARWLDRPTWDRTVTPNVVKRTGSRPTRRRR